MGIEVRLPRPRQKQPHMVSALNVDNECAFLWTAFLFSVHVPEGNSKRTIAACARRTPWGQPPNHLSRILRRTQKHILRITTHGQTRANAVPNINQSINAGNHRCILDILMVCCTTANEKTVTFCSPFSKQQRTVLHCHRGRGTDTSRLSGQSTRH